MVSESQQCPPDETLAEYAGNDLPFGDAVALEEHFARCRPCLERFMALGRPSLTPDVPNCHVVKEIGRGRFGVVYKAWRLGEKPRMVALKVLSRPGEMEQSRFDREIAVLKRLDSPGIVKCLESGVSGDAVYYVMELVEGVHLDEYLESSGDDLCGKLEVFERVCRAVADAHAEGVIHRDLKPRNILIDRDGRPHILDFGICSVNDADWSSWEHHTITHPGDVIGTLKYMSPEQAWGGAAGAIDERSDIWALGIMLHELVTNGAYPYSLERTPGRPAHEALLDRIRHELPQLPRLDAIPRGRDLEVLLERCLTWDPDQRIESAAKLAGDLQRYRDGRKIKTKPLWIPYRLKRLAVGAAARSRWMFSVVFVAALGLALWVTSFLFGVGWHVTGSRYQGGAGALESGQGAAMARDTVLIAGVFDDTVGAVVKFAEANGIEGVTRNHTSWRAVHGYLMKRLATARPRAIVWDYFFRKPRAADEQLAAGFSALERAGVPVVLAVKRYGDDGRPELSPRLLEPFGSRPRHGAITARDMVRRPGEFVTVIERPGKTLIPSLALATLAAVLHPQTRLDLDWRERGRPIHLLYEEPGRAYLRERDVIELTRAVRARSNHGAIRVGNLVGCSVFELDNPASWRERTVHYETLLTCTDAALRGYTAGKVVVVGDLRPRRIWFPGDRHRVKYGSSIVNDVPGCYLLADAIAGFLNRRYLRMALPLPPMKFFLMLAVATAGCLLPIRLAAGRSLARRKTRVILWAGLFTLSMAFFGMMTVAKTYLAVHMGMVGFSLLVPMIGSFWVELTRNRHRIPNRGRQPFDNFSLATAGTVTLPMRRPKAPTGAA